MIVALINKSRNNKKSVRRRLKRKKSAVVESRMKEPGSIIAHFDKTVTKRQRLQQIMFAITRLVAFSCFAEAFFVCKCGAVWQLWVEWREKCGGDWKRLVLWMNDWERWMFLGGWLNWTLWIGNLIREGHSRLLIAPDSWSRSIKAWESSWRFWNVDQGRSSLWPIYESSQASTSFLEQQLKVVWMCAEHCIEIF